MSRVYERKKGEWWIDFKDARGIRRRKKVGPSKRVAREVLDGLLGNVARRVHLGVIEDSAISFPDFAKIWRDRITPTLKSRTRERWSASWTNTLSLPSPARCGRSLRLTRRRI